MMRGVERDGRHEMERERERDWGTFKGGQGGREREQGKGAVGCVFRSVRDDVP